MAEEPKISFTPGETKILVSIMANLQGDLNTDWAAVATDCGLKDANIARTRWSQIKRGKIKSQNSTSSNSGTPVKKTATAATTKGTPKGTPKSKAATAAGAAAAGMGSGKKGDKRKGFGTVSDSDDDEEEDTPFKRFRRDVKVEAAAGEVEGGDGVKVEHGVKVEGQDDGVEA